MPDWLLVILPLLIGWLLDLMLGDPLWLPHPVVGFGKMIAFGERHLNKGNYRKVKGALMSIILIVLVFAVSWLFCQLSYELCSLIPSGQRTVNCPTSYARLDLQVKELSTVNYQLSTIANAILIFYCLAGTTLIREVRMVFLALDRSLDEGRRQVARIVGRDTSELSAQEIRTAALETLAENLSDGVIAPLFWLAVGGVPAMMAYKMVNTLDSMIGYRTERYKEFGCWAARIDDVANYIPARITALLMIIAAGKPQCMSFIWHNGCNHASPNSGYPEAALAGILDCRFGGPHYYFGELFEKPYIGNNARELTTADMLKAVRINRTAEVIAIISITVIYCLCN